jgi:N-carbamoylputrescine amidase
MKAALVVNRVLPDVDANLAAILRMASEAADAGAQLVVFPEAALTGLTNSDDPSHDLPLGQTIPGPVTDVLAELVRKRHIWLAIGLLEREGGDLYDSAVLFTPGGEIGLKQRRIHPGWHCRRADPSVYHPGAELLRAETPLGIFAFSICCSDLFDDGLIQRVRGLRPDWLLCPLARCFEDGSYNQERWDREEKLVYVERVKLAGITALMTNYLAEVSLDGGSFGGAMVVSGDGTVVDSFPLGKVGMLLVDVRPP